MTAIKVAIGKKYNMLTVLSREENNSRGNTIWKCICDCGKEVVVDGYSISSGHTKSCGCVKSITNKNKGHIDRVGEIYGDYEVVEFHEKHKNNISWKCKCITCGNEKIIRYSNLRYGKGTTCKECHPISHTRIKPLHGMVFGRLTVMDKYKKRNGLIHWKCVCECGNIKYVSSNELVQGKTKSCGCLLLETLERGRLLHKTHGDSKSRLYKEYFSMIGRCSESYHGRKNYYDRNIFVCNEWADKNNGYIAFKQWALKNGYSDSLTLDRIDTNGNYCPDNCRWVDSKVQQNNRTNNRIVVINGESKTLRQWSDFFGINYGTVKARIYNGWSEYDALTTPLKK